MPRFIFAQCFKPGCDVHILPEPAGELVFQHFHFVRGKIVGREKLRIACDNAGFLVQFT